MQKKVIYKEPKGYFNADMLKAAEEWEKEQKAKQEKAKQEAKKNKK